MAEIKMYQGDLVPFQARPISFKPPRLKGLSARLIASHYENNYGGHVRRLNAIRADLPPAAPPDTPPGPLPPGRVGRPSALPPERTEARGADRHQLDAAARGLLRGTGRGR